MFVWCVVKEEEGRIEKQWLFVLFIYIYIFFPVWQVCRRVKEGGTEGRMPQSSQRFHELQE